MTASHAGRQPTAKSPRRPGPKAWLSQERIVAAAFRVSEQAGAQGITFQAIGDELEAHPTAIYRHFRTKDDLMLALLDALHAEALEATPQPGGDWVQELRELARATHAAFMRHPHVAQFSGARTARRQHEFAKVDRVIGCMLRAGFSPEDAARNYRVFSDFVLAYSAQDASLAALDTDTKNTDMRAWTVDYRTLPREEYPNIHAVAHALPALDDPQNFETALEMMLESLQSSARTTSGTG
ncbi:TetR family transcriptional regulator [Nocardioides eburneiflavus]|uniref:TetR family transcriptional regulator n=1 Tax=Nocardioides eburneiflavus TaxID=2518372 RepID=A0A4Z1C7Y8_9ACTN|nr:TetR/AcrR family transcriptional regulator C-terminal domain-containing protein [Nocardioides eburneiflavus]TGN65752.1 TetR family transcriptional regulator [Nocardioides eburneiflavus]